MRPVKTTEWQLDAVEIMARTGCGLVQAAKELEVDITVEESSKIYQRKGFQKILWDARHRYNTDIGRDPGFGQDAIVGKMLLLAEKLDEEGSFDKAAEVLLKIAKIRGYVGPEGQVNVFGELSQKDLDAIRETVVKPSKVQ